VFWVSSAFAAPVTRVNVMPDRQARPSVAIPIFGSADGGVGTHNADGSTYDWTFAFNAANVSMSPAGNVLGVAVGNDRNIVVNKTFTLISSTRQTITATLTVRNGVTSQSKSVKIDVVDPSDPSIVDVSDPTISTAALANLKVNVNIAIEDGLRALYLQQDTSSGGFQYGAGGGAGSAGVGVNNCATTGFTIWAFSNAGHRPTNPVANDIYSEWVQRAVNFILDGNASSIAPGSLYPPFYANLTYPTDVDGNGNGRLIGLCSYPGSINANGTSSAYPDGYASPIAAAGLEAAYSANPATVHPSGPFATSTYFTIIQDALDWLAYTQMDGDNHPSGCGATAYYRGGWRYSAGDCGNADTSIESWNYVALEGFESVFLGKVPEKVKLEVERRLDSSQWDGWNGTAPPTAPFANGSYGRFGYAYDTYLVSGSGHEQAKTAGGISGLNMVQHCNDASVANCNAGTHTRTPQYLEPGQAFSSTATARFSGGGSTTVGSFGSVANRKLAAIRHLGLRFDQDTSTVGCDTWSRNRTNPYAMWTTARALRLNGTTQLFNANYGGGTTFDWQTGETTANPGVVPGGPLEGYFPWLVGQQQTSGMWGGDCSGYYPANVFTAMAELILQPKVFPAAGNCDLGAASISTLPYPLDHSLRNVTITGVSAPTQITAICQDENPNFENIAPYAQDGFITTTTTTGDTAQVRAEFSGNRSQPSNGRVYHIFYSAPTLQCGGEVLVRMNTTPGGTPTAVDGGKTWNSITGANSCPQ
jgi:hypothetical protein